MPILTTEKDPLGKGVQDYLRGRAQGDLLVYSDIAEPDTIPISYLFRDESELPEIEAHALECCRGRILDIGAGAGCHSLILQDRGMDVTASDISPGAAETMRARGLMQVTLADYREIKDGTFDTILMLMNGIGIAGRLANLGDFFSWLKINLAPGGQLLLDSSNIAYMLDEGASAGSMPRATDSYYGEVRYQMAYADCWGDPFDWLFVDFPRLENIASSHGWKCSLIKKGEHYDYLAILTALGE